MYYLFVSALGSLFEPLGKITNKQQCNKQEHKPPPTITSTIPSEMLIIIHNHHPLPFAIITYQRKDIRGIYDSRLLSSIKIFIQPMDHRSSVTRFAILLHHWFNPKFVTSNHHEAKAETPIVEKISPKFLNPLNPLNPSNPSKAPAAIYHNYP